MNTEFAVLVDELVARGRFSREAAIVGVRANFCCEFCGRQLLHSVEDYDVWENDHIVPVSKGGPEDSDDSVHLALSCRFCNKMKRAWLPEGGGEMSREALIAAAKLHIDKKREEKEALLNTVREIVTKHGGTTTITETD